MFLDRETYGQAKEYSLLPFRFLPLDNQREILVTDAGEWLIEPRGTASKIVRRELDTSSLLYQRLRAKQFVYDNLSLPLLDIAATKFRTKKSFLDGFTKLHIFVVTLRCEHSCHYCQVSRQTQDKSLYDMSRETAAASIDLMLDSPAEVITLEFQGGEPLLAFDLIQYIVEEAKNRAAKVRKIIDPVVATNLAVVTDSMLHYFRDQGIKISTSLDGPAWLHNQNRPRPGGNSYEVTIEGIQRARDIVGWENVAALMTTTQLSLDHPIEIIDEYVRQKFHSIFLRCISPYGFAVRTRERTGYEIERFLEFYRKGLTYILELNRGGTDLAEVFATILLTKILTPFPTHFVDLQSPSGAGIGAVVYNYNGDVYASDESRMLAEMGDDRFRLGNVHRQTRNEMFGGDALVRIVRDGVAEALPGCTDCALQAFCGGDPVYHYTTQGHTILHQPTSGFCKKNMSIIKLLLDMIATGDPIVNRIFWAWVRRKGMHEISVGAPQ